jgi:hypothetical protein
LPQYFNFIHRLLEAQGLDADSDEQPEPLGISAMFCAKILKELAARMVE